jgi:hypothetical protein
MSSNNIDMEKFYNNSMNEIYPNFKSIINMKKVHTALLKSIFFIGIILLGANHNFAQTAITCAERNNIKIAAPALPASGVTYSWLLPMGAIRTNALGSPDTLIVFDAMSLTLGTTHRVRLVASNSTCSDTSFIDLSFPNCLPSNRFPIALNDTTGTYKNTTLNNTVAFNDKDPDGNLNVIHVGGLSFLTPTARMPTRPHRVFWVETASNTVSATLARRACAIRPF